VRFARVTPASATAVTVRASVRPAPRRGGFACDDPALTAIWSTAAYTLRSCMQTFLIDGIKRDRMPWIGDHALGVLTNAFTFADGAIVRDTLTALGRPRGGYINGIADYSLWWVISQGLYQRYFDDTDHLAREAERIEDFLTDLAGHAGPDGVFRPADLPDAFEQAGPGSLFLDWGVTLRADADAVAVQMLWLAALRAGGSVLAKADHPGAPRWKALADILHETLLDRAWDAGSGHWREYLDSDGAPTAYPNFLATLAGIRPPVADAESVRIAPAIEASVTGTPFMRAFAMLGLGRLGRREGAVAEVRRLWGRMLDAGAATFWEEFDDSAESPYEMYGRPFGKSLCHAWSAGPAVLLPQLVLGLEPLADGWAEFVVAPQLGELGWAGAVVPTPHGDITVLVQGDDVTVDVPAGTTALLGSARHIGPVRVQVRLTQTQATSDAASRALFASDGPGIRPSVTPPA
jgi:alpha-L-rhamnosidase